MLSHPQASALRRFVWPKSLVLLLGFLLPSTNAIHTPLRDLSNPGRQTSTPSTGQAAYSIPPTVPESEEARFWQAPLHLVNGLDQCKTQEVYAKRIDGPSFRHLPDRPVTTTPSSAKVQLTGLTQHSASWPSIYLMV
jgi:hypothetical protein